MPGSPRGSRPRRLRDSAPRRCSSTQRRRRAEVAAAQAALGAARAATVIEDAFRGIARALADAGVDAFVVAGGETAGAVVEALGVRALAIGPEIAPGVPWTRALGGRPLWLALKSGNFGGDDFFARASASL